MLITADYGLIPKSCLVRTARLSQSGSAKSNLRIRAADVRLKGWVQ
jgi:hypothetical protein